MSTAVAQEVVTEISEITEKKTRNDKTYWLIKGDKTYKTWNQKSAYTAKELLEKSSPAKIIFHEDTWQGTERMMTDYLVDELVEAPAGTEPEKAMGRKDWDEKEDREHVRRLYTTHLIQMTNWWMTIGDRERQTAQGEAFYQELPSYDDVMKWAHAAAVKDLIWIRTYATGDVPFG